MVLQVPTWSMYTQRHSTSLLNTIKCLATVIPILRALMDLVAGCWPPAALALVGVLIVTRGP